MAKDIEVTFKDTHDLSNLIKAKAAKQAAGPTPDELNKEFNLGSEEEVSASMDATIASLVAEEVPETPAQVAARHQASVEALVAEEELPAAISPVTAPNTDEVPASNTAGVKLDYTK